LNTLLTLRALSPTGPFVTRCSHDGNANGRIFGGQLLGQGLAAALATIDPARRPTMLQALFLRGAVPELPIQYAVVELQEGKRFSSRTVTGLQDGRAVISLQVSAMAEGEPQRAVMDTTVAALPAPESLLRHHELPPALLARFGGQIFRADTKASLDMRLVDPAAELAPVNAPARLRYWIRARHGLPDTGPVQAAALAYVSDYWLPYAASAQRFNGNPKRPLYLASLNHDVWFLGPCRADEWLYVCSEGVDPGGGRVLVQARVHTRDGRQVMAWTQESMLVDPPAAQA
jgi:acyl-CoA thioesterase II